MKDIQELKQEAKVLLQALQDLYDRMEEGGQTDAWDSCYSFIDEYSGSIKKVLQAIEEME
jgi:tRNA uridine 5-carbamoylmethylation protein Kti12